MKAKMSLTSDKCSNSYIGEEKLGLTGEALENFQYALYEVIFDVDVNEKDGEVQIEAVNGVRLMTPELEAEIERLKQGFVRIIWEVKAGATDTEVNAICREMLGIEGEA
jgi:hypothetical protein